MATRIPRFMEGRLIICRNPECRYEFGQDEARVCKQCHEHICPQCGDCGCFAKRERINFTWEFGTE